MDKLEFKRLTPDAKLPERGHPDDAGLDIYAAETVTIEPQEKLLLDTDLAVNIPKGYVGLLTSRSGISSKTDLIVETGKIDAGFHGHMRVSIKNDFQNKEGVYVSYVKNIKNVKITDDLFKKSGAYQINKGDKIAQLLIVPIVTPEAIEVDEFNNTTARGEQGFGSTGY